MLVAVLATIVRSFAFEFEETPLRLKVKLKMRARAGKLIPNDCTATQAHTLPICSNLRRVGNAFEPINSSEEGPSTAPRIRTRMNDE